LANVVVSKLELPLRSCETPSAGTPSSSSTARLSLSPSGRLKTTSAAVPLFAIGSSPRNRITERSRRIVPA
jgi:hypothetical protein